MKKIINALMGLLVIAVIVLVILGLIGVAIYSFTTNLLGSVLTPLILAGVAVYVQRETNKREITKRHFECKRERYESFVDTLFQLMMPEQMDKEKLSTNDLIKELVFLNKTLMLWGNAETIKTFNKFKADADKKRSNQELFLLGDTLVRSLRKDLGHKDLFQLPRGELSLIFLKGSEHEKVRGGG